MLSSITKLHTPLGLQRSSFRLASLVTENRSISTVAPAQIHRFMKAKGEQNVIPVDASWYMPGDPIDAFIEFRKERFNNRSVFFDIDKVADQTSKFPHMLPRVEVFEKEVGSLGIPKDAPLLLYDQKGIFSCCRAAWMFEVFGHDPDEIYVLNTYPSFKQTFGDPNLVMVIHELHNRIDSNLVTSPSAHQPVEYNAEFDPSKVVNYEELKKLVEDGKIGSEYTLIDARSHDRFTAKQKEPRKEVKSGHIPGAKNIPFNEVLTPEQGFLSPMTIKHVVEKYKVDDSKPIIVMCGTGVTACVVRMGLILAGFDPDKVAIYDGSWTEWGQRAPEELIVSGEEDAQ